MKEHNARMSDKLVLMITLLLLGLNATIMIIKATEAEHWRREAHKWQTEAAQEARAADTWRNEYAKVKGELGVTK